VLPAFFSAPDIVWSRGLVMLQLINRLLGPSGNGALSRERALRLTNRSTPQPKAPDQRLVSRCVRSLEVVEQAPPLADHDQEPAP
jgi:hypothetical protein